jgi:hypothetical protein
VAHVLISKIYFFALVFFGACNLDDGNCRCLDEPDAIYVFSHFFLEENHLDLAQEFQRVVLIATGGDCDVDVRFG